LKQAAGIVAIAALAIASRAAAWSRPAHMVTAAIAYEELGADPAARALLLDLLEAHPDRAPFEVAVDRTTGEARQRRLFYECARWADDARGTPYDHPTWHYAARPVIAADFPADRPKPTNTEGAASEAYALNIRVLGNAKAAKPERALALCWVMHLVGDIHQPLHSAQLFSRAFPDGDQLGSRQFVRETADNPPVTLHWYWDDRVHRSGIQDSVEARARGLAARFPRAAFGQPVYDRQLDSFVAWARDESYPLAVSQAYGPALVSSPEASAAPVAKPDYAATTRDAAERRLTLAGYRLADVLRAALTADAAR
jgi:hypothetical protein